MSEKHYLMNSDGSKFFPDEDAKEFLVRTCDWAGCTQMLTIGKQQQLDKSQVNELLRWVAVARIAMAPPDEFDKDERELMIPVAYHYCSSAHACRALEEEKYAYA
jgi:hypothetical protein